MTSKVEELRHHLVIELADLGSRPHPEGWHEDLADAEKEVDALIAVVEERTKERILSCCYPIGCEAIMEIPSGKMCEGCAYLDSDNDDTVDIRTCTLFKGIWAEGDPERGIECLFAYPNGATITITAKEVTP